MLREEYLTQIRRHLRTSYLLSDKKIESVLPGFLATLCDLMAKLEAASAEGKETEAINRAGHALKGALLSLGLMDLADKAYLIEKFGQPESGIQEYEPVLTGLRQEIAKLC